MGVSVCTNAPHSVCVHHPCWHTFAQSNRNGSDTRRQKLWLMHQAHRPAVVGVCVLITLSACFISSWRSLMNGLALSLPASLAVLSPNRLCFWGANRSHPLFTHNTHPRMQRAPPQIGRCVCQVVKDMMFMTVSLLLNSLTYIWRIIQAPVVGHMCFDCWILSHCWDLVPGDGQFNNTCRWPLVFLHSYC